MHSLMRYNGTNIDRGYYRDIPILLIETYVNTLALNLH